MSCCYEKHNSIRKTLSNQPVFGEGIVMNKRILILIVLIVSSLAVWKVQARHGQLDQPAERVYEEAQTVYLGNLARRANGVPPLRWNYQLTEAGRWFSWDSVENRIDPYCGHQDTLGNWPDYRALFFGYKGYSGAENAFCGYVTPQQAIDGWMNSAGHRANLLDPGSREVGLGYYLRLSDGRGYVTQDFGQDPVYPPVIIENEAINTTSTQVNLYIYDRASGGGFSEMGPATEMLISNNPCFSGANWQLYQSAKSWALDGGTGWRSVYVKTRDTLQRTVTVSDTIYLGASAPLTELGQAQMSTNQDTVTLYEVDTTGLPQVQFSLGWRVDNTYGTFGRLWGNGEQVSDASAWGGTAYRMFDGDGESSAWVWTTEFIKDTPMMGYVRLKISNNTSPNEAARFSVTGGSTVSLKGTDFLFGNQYQEFPVSFTFPGSETFLTFQFWRSGAADVYVDALTIFTAPQAVTSPIQWAVPRGNYRGQGIWLRYTNGSNLFSATQEASLAPSGLSAAPAALNFLAGLVGNPPPTQSISVHQSVCTPITWQASDNASWLQMQIDGNTLRVSVDATGLGIGVYHALVTIQAINPPEVAPLEIPVTLHVVQQVYDLYLPVLLKYP